jgi:hypothetical protein
MSARVPVNKLGLLGLLSAALIAAANGVHAGEPATVPAHPAMQALDDNELRAVSARLQWRLRATAPPGLPNAKRIPMLEDGPADLFLVRLRIPTLLNADVEFKDASYGPGMPFWTNAQDGSYVLSLPEKIGEIDARNLRCGPNDSLHLGSLQILGLDMQNTTISVSLHK